MDEDDEPELIDLTVDEAEPTMVDLSAEDGDSTDVLANSSSEDSHDSAGAGGSTDVLANSSSEESQPGSPAIPVNSGYTVEVEGPVDVNAVCWGPTFEQPQVPEPEPADEEVLQYGPSEEELAELVSYLRELDNASEPEESESESGVDERTGLEDLATCLLEAEPMREGLEEPVDVQDEDVVQGPQEEDPRAHRRSMAIRARLTRPRDHVIPKAHFRRMVRDTLGQLQHDDIRMSSQALDAMQTVVEKNMSHMFRVANQAVAHAGRVTMNGSDIRLAREINRRRNRYENFMHDMC
jgi:histone H3/H4